MQLQELFKQARVTLPSSVKPEWAGRTVSGVTSDSRLASLNSLFVAIDGAAVNGATFVPQAVAKGAAIVMSHHGPNAVTTIAGRDILHLASANPRRDLALLAAAFYGAQPAEIAAITGTNGKTSTADFLRQIWMMQGFRSASIGTLGLVSKGLDLRLPPLTTPDPVKLAETLHELKTRRVDHVALEASSHGLDQFRLDGVRLTRAGFSNLTRDHLDYHHTLDAYRDAKLRLFREVLPTGGVAAINADMDSETLAILKDIATSRALALRTVGMGGETLRLVSATPLPTGQRLKLCLNGEMLDDITIPLIGRVQVDNILLAAALAWDDEDSARQICQGLTQLQGVRGRCEFVATSHHGASIFVDYAHTPDALGHVLQSLRPHARHRLTVIFGAGGNRDQGKRPLMGQIAARYADQCIVTDDNPRDEDPATIRRAVMQGCPDATEIGDRHTAIAHAVLHAEAGDIVVVTGKGHETGQIIKGAVHPFDDAAVIREILTAAQGGSDIEAANGVNAHDTPG
ncbi:UDP-N-acetylmuramoyl-L-alanyl-D-glutamate--2,6-diaminopimelate ligase [Candidatus Kirkpatrickella diaphorinae]|uniref:UDP-N-acetylmuramoyl-L-alanyl-D-glutamate--2,6-diaminopimelate ligase n=1 Tax=Candidatus Kirkpatrickella diaphorinae TaxID=2984322 RepID=A0ABY6GKZ2_9PROT|nr:UDP-N-acetylmuramoyl-L-alanyl-D-glutamate--2,6-diaminopimelate ligase [Candidatus Kirkpatrickella diaphorinae]